MELFKLARSIALRLLQEPVQQHQKSNWIVHIFIGCLLLFEIFGGLLIIKKIAYTEIDWVAYMQEVSGFLSGERNYYNLRGDTGPLVYPAGFVYIYSALYYITDEGQNIELAQYIFLGVYLALVAVVMGCYIKCGGIPTWALGLLVLSKRVHSIFMLRCFNDGIAMLLVYISIFFFSSNKWRFGSVFFSLAVSVKMNILLFAPGLLLLFLQSQGVLGTIICLSICAGIQVLLGLPFLLTYPVAYLHRSFELGRVFMYKWTVNFKFLNEETFVSKSLSVYLLLLMVMAIASFANKWLSSVKSNSIFCSSIIINSSTASTVCSQLTFLVCSTYIFKDGPSKLDPYYTTLTLFTSNFIGIVFARTLHYQFYCWYFHTLPLLAWHGRLPLVLKLAAVASVEWAFNVFPATPASSLVLQLSHVLLLGALWTAPLQNKLRTKED
ncbi:unnamed protein product [Heterosigma akashiwo]